MRLTLEALVSPLSRISSDNSSLGVSSAKAALSGPRKDFSGVIMEPFLQNYF